MTGEDAPAPNEQSSQCSDANDVVESNESRVGEANQKSNIPVVESASESTQKPKNSQPEKSSKRVARLRADPLDDSAALAEPIQPAKSGGEEKKGIGEKKDVRKAIGKSGKTAKSGKKLTATPDDNKPNKIATKTAAKSASSKPKSANKKKARTTNSKKSSTKKSSTKKSSTKKTKAKTSKANPAEAKSSKPKPKSSKPKATKTKSGKTKAKSGIAKSKRGKSNRNPLKVSNQLTASRRKEIERALEDQSSSPKGWSRATGAKQHSILRKRVKPGQIRTISFPLLESRMGDDWPTRLTVIHGARPGPVVTILGAVHGDELVGPLALTHLLGSAFIGPGRPLDPAAMAGTIRIVPVVNLPGYRMHTRYFPDGRDLNRAFPGNKVGNTTSRVAHRVWHELVSKSDYVIDLHSAARGRTNLPQVRADLADPKSNMLARSFGIEVILDSRGPRGSLRRISNEANVGYVTYEGGGANTADSEALQVAIHGILNSLRNLHVISGNPSRPRFRLLAAGSIWLRADEGGLLDVITPAGSFVEKDDVVATITDPERPGAIVSLTTPESGLLICTATNPYVNAGSPVGHLLPISRGVKTIVSRLDSQNRLVISGTDGEPPWRDEAEVDEITVDGAWSGGHVDAEWQADWGMVTNDANSVLAEEEADEA